MALYYSETIGQALRAELGFDDGSPYVKINGEYREAFTVENVTPGGIFGRAGFREGDIIVHPHGRSIPAFYRMLDAKRGNTVTVTVVDGGDGPPLDQRPTRQIQFRIAEKV